MIIRNVPTAFLASTVIVLFLQMSSRGQGKKSENAPTTFPPLITVPEVHASPTPPEVKAGASADKLVENFFSLLGKNQVDEAYDQLTNGTKIAEKPEDIATLKAKTREAVRIFGEIQGYELITIKNVGNHLVRSTYLSLGKGFPLIWKFYFYNSDKAWRLIDIRVDDRLVDMFDERNPKTPGGEQ